MAVNSIWTMRGIVLLAAVLVWANVYAFTDKVTEIDAPLLVEGLNSQLAFDQPVSTIKAVVAGKSAAVSRLNQENLNFYLDAHTTTQGGTQAYEVKLKNIPSGIRLIKWEPRILSLSASQVISKEVEIEALTKGDTPDNLVVQNITTEPSRVQVISSPAILEGISKAYTYVSLEGKKNSFSGQGQIFILDAKGNPLQNAQLSPTTTKINVELVPGVPFKHLGVKPSIEGSVPSGYWIEEISLEPSVVMIKGRQTLLNNLDFASTTPLRVGGRTSDFTEEVAIDFPNGLEMVGENIIKVRVRVGLQGNVRQFEITPRFVNLNPDFTVNSITPETIKVVVLGSEEQLKNLNKNDIQLNLDLSSVITGPNTVELSPAQISVPDGIRIESISATKVEIIVSRQ